MIDTEKLRRLREALKLTQQEAAERAGLRSRQRWHQIESGAIINLELMTLEKIAQAVGVKAKDLLK